jgi:hypothetical protein
VLEAVTIIALSMPIWAIPISFLVVCLRGTDDDESDSNVQFKSASSQAKIMIERFDRAFLPKPHFKPRSLSECMSKRILRARTYLALDFGKALCGYFYLTTSTVITLVLYLLFLEVAGILFLAMFTLQVYIVSLIAGLVLMSLIFPCVWALFSGADPVFVQPYYYLLSNAVAHPDRKAIRADFAPVMDLITDRLKEFGYYDEDLGYFLIPSDRAFVDVLAQTWELHRSTFLKQEEISLGKGSRARARFLIERQKQAQQLANLAYIMRMSWEKWVQDAPFVFYDLEMMLDEQGIDQNTSAKIQRGRESLEKLREIRRDYPLTFNIREEVSASPQFWQVDGRPEPILIRTDGILGCGVVSVLNPTRLKVTIRPLWLIVGERRWSHMILLKRNGDDRILLAIKLAPREKTDVELHFRFSHDCPTGVGELVFACSNRLDHVSLHVKFPEDR